MELLDIDVVRRGHSMVAICPLCRKEREATIYDTSKRKEGREEAVQSATGLARRRVLNHAMEEHPDEMK